MEEVLTEIPGTPSPLTWKVNGEDFLNYGVYVSASKGIIEALEMKDPVVEDWKGQHGVFMDLAAPRYEPRTIELDCFLKGEGELDFYEKVRAFVQAFQKPGLQEFIVEFSDKPLIFMVAMQNSMDMDKRWNPEEMIGTFNIALREPQPIKRLLKYVHSGSSDIDNSLIDSTWNAVAYGGNRYVAVADDSNTNAYAMISENAIVWGRQVAAGFYNWRGVCWGDGVFVAVADDSHVMTSPDGANWTLQTAANSNSWYAVCYGNGLFVAVSTDGSSNQVMTSPDGETWTERTTPENNVWRSVVYGNGLFVAVSDNGTHRVMTSTDGITWISRTASEASTWYGVTYGNGLFVAVAYSGTNRVMTSPDGITWTSRTAPAQSWVSVTYGKGLYVAVAFSGTGNRIMTSPDGSVWTNRTTPHDNNWRNITFGGGKFVAVSRDGDYRVMSSSDGFEWIDNSTNIFELSFTSENSINIFWGDGQVSYDVYGENISAGHEYEEAGTYFILLAGVIEEITDFSTTAQVVWSKY